MKTKTIIPIAVIALFLSLAFAPAASAQQVAVTVVPKDGEEYYTEIVEVSDMETLKTKLAATTELVLESIKTIDWNGIIPVFLNAEEKAAIAKNIEEIKTLLGCTLWTVDMLMPLLAFDICRRNIVCSIGWGASLMLFNKYEAGVRLLPFLKTIRFLMTTPSHTGYWKILPGIEYGDKAGTHIVAVRLLQGIYIDGGSLGRERLFNFGVAFILGRGYVSVYGLH